jgi:hypothetical protein
LPPDAKAFPLNEPGAITGPGEERMFFFEKKNQKTFAYPVRCRRVSDSIVKSLFGLLFRKEDLLLPP